MGAPNQGQADRTGPSARNDMGEREAAAPELTSQVRVVLAAMSGDPFVQAAIWRVYVNTPHLLDEYPVSAISLALGNPQ